jgi:hypothetical protein
MGVGARLQQKSGRNCAMMDTPAGPARQPFLKGVRMIQYVCDSCGKVKKEKDDWIVGLAAESVGVTTSRREVDIMSVWMREHAVHPFAVHFCSERCKDRYMKRLFESSPAA